MQTCGGQWRGWRRGRGADWSGNLKTAPRVARSFWIHLSSFVASHQLARMVPKFKFLMLGCPYCCLFTAACLGVGGAFSSPWWFRKRLFYIFCFFLFQRHRKQKRVSETG